MPANKKGTYHNNRVNEEIARELVYILKEVKDPRVSKAFISITRTDTTADLKYCKVYYSVLNADVKEVKEGLKSALGFIRRELSSRLNLRVTPELSFILDEGMEHGAKIAQILKNI
jgi:ribosome-binding factor A